MKRFLTVIIVLAMVLSLFMTTALADKPAKEPKDEEDTYVPAMGDPGEGEDPGDIEEPGDEEDEQDGPKKPNEKRDAKKLFKEETSPLIDEIHANREEWGALGEQQDMLSECIDAYIEGIVEQGGVLDEATIAFIKEKIDQIKVLKSDMKGLKDEIHTLWKTYIEAKKVSDVEAADAALSAIIVNQEARISVRLQIVEIMNELCPVLGVEAPAQEPVEGEVPGDEAPGDEA